MVWCHHMNKWWPIWEMYIWVTVCIQHLPRALREIVVGWVKSMKKQSMKKQKVRKFSSFCDYKFLVTCDMLFILFSDPLKFVFSQLIINSLPLERCDCNLKLVICILISRINILSIFCRCLHNVAVAKQASIIAALFIYTSVILLS